MHLSAPNTSSAGVHACRLVFRGVCGRASEELRLLPSQDGRKSRSSRPRYTNNDDASHMYTAVRTTATAGETMPANPRHQGREGGPALMAVALDASEFPKVGTTQQKLGPPSLPELFQILFPQHSEPPAGKGWNQAAVAQSVPSRISSNLVKA